MPKLMVVAVRDSAINGFMRPIFVQSIGVAFRSFVDEVSNKESAMFAHPEDYELYCLAEFDDDSGTFALPAGGVHLLARGKDAKQ